MVEASLLDLDHSARIYLTIEVNGGRVVEARGEMPKVPFEACVKPLENLPTLVGLRVERGVVKQAAERLGGENGCVHLVELAVTPYA